MDDFGEKLLRVAANNLTTVLIGGGCIAAIIVIVLIYRMMGRPLAGYHAGVDPESWTAPPQSTEAGAHQPSIQRRRAAAPLSTQLLPADTNAERAEQNETADHAASPAEPRPSDLAPKPVLRTAAAVQPVPMAERTVNIGRATPVVVRPAASLNGATHRNLLVIRSGSRNGERIRLDSFSNGQCAVGRSDVPENQVVIRDDLKVSRVQHAILVCGDDGRCFIQDNNSANKVYVNEERIDVAAVPLSNGDKIRIGLTEFEYLQEPILLEMGL